MWVIPHSPGEVPSQAPALEYPTRTGHTHKEGAPRRARVGRLTLPGEPYLSLCPLY